MSTLKHASQAAYKLRKSDECHNISSSSAAQDMIQDAVHACAIPCAKDPADAPSRPLRCQSAIRRMYCILFAEVTGMSEPSSRRSCVTRPPNVSSSTVKSRPRSSAGPAYLFAPHHSQGEAYTFCSDCTEHLISTLWSHQGTESQIWLLVSMWCS